MCLFGWEGLLSASLDQQGHPVFGAHPSPTLILDTRFVIRAANRAYLAQAGRTSEDILGRDVFEAFPDNHDDPECDGAANLRASLMRVLATGREHHMAVQRYDVVLPESGGFVTKFWAPVNSPIHEGDTVVGVLHRVEDLTQLEEDLRNVLTHCRRVTETGQVTPEEARGFTDSATAFAAGAQQFQGLADEVLHLRRALSSRATIEQAKGIVMAERHCGPERAYGVLVHMSNQTNVRLADVAAALVYQAQGPRRLEVDSDPPAQNPMSLAHRRQNAS